MPDPHKTARQRAYAASQSRGIETPRIGITLEDDGWWWWCPDCETAAGPYKVRGRASATRGKHLVDYHDAVPMTAMIGHQKARRAEPDDLALVQKALELGVLSQLSQWEQAILLLRGLTGKHERLTLRLLAERLGVSRIYMCLEERRALAHVAQLVAESSCPICRERAGHHRMDCPNRRGE